MKKKKILLEYNSKLAFISF